MKKIILLIMCLALCSCSTTKTLINYKGTCLLKEYKVTEHKEVKRDYSNLFPAFKGFEASAEENNASPVLTYIFSNFLFGIPLAIDIITTPFLLVYDSIVVKEKSYRYNAHARIAGKIVNMDKTPISNQNIQFGNKDSISSNINGIFEKTIDTSFSDFKDKQQYYPDKFILNFNNGKSTQDIKMLFQNGKDISINNPHEICIKLDSEQENSLYLEKYDLTEKETIRSKNKDVIVLSSQTLSAQYYRDKIKKEKEDALLKAKQRLKETGIENINTEAIVLTNEELNNDWEYNLEKKIYDDVFNQAKTKLEKQTGYTYYDSEVKQIICEEEYTNYGKNEIRKVKSNWKAFVNEEIKKQKQKEQKRQDEIEKFKHDPDVHAVQSQITRCPQCYRLSLIVSIWMKTGDPYHQGILYACKKCGYIEQKFNGF